MKSRRSGRDTLASRLVLPIVAFGVLLTLLGAGYLVAESRRTIEHQALQQARSIAYQIGQDRRQIAAFTDKESLEPDLLHATGMSVDGEGLYRVGVLGMWPIESAHKAQPGFEAAALETLWNNPAAEPHRLSTVNGEPTLTLLRADLAENESCVDCHASELDKTAHSLAVGKPIGAVRIELPLGPALTKARNETLLAVGLLAFIMAGAIVGVLGVVRHHVERPVAALLPAVEPLARGDFSQPVRVRAEAEIARIVDAVETTRSQVAAVLGELAGTAQSVQGASGDLATRCGLLASGSQQQAASLEETSASIQSMTDSVRTNARHAQEAKSIASRTRDEAEAGGQVVAAAVQAMSGISNASRRIADISTTIDEIAFQTNLLALNAAVEAARAGEQGRSFAVVAGEVRALAQRSAAASKEIKTVITDAVNRADEGNQLVGRAGAALTKIVGEVKQVADLVADIAGASVAQAEGIEQVNRAVEEMDRVTQQTANQTEELNGTARLLADQARDLRRQVGHFKLEGGEPHAAAPAAAAQAPPPPVPLRRPTARRAAPSARPAPKPAPALAATGTDGDGFEEF